jgi:allophanate hydrolase
VIWISRVEGALARAGVGPLAGMTFAIKDNIDYAGLPTTAACPAYAYQPIATAPVVQALEDAGAVLVGKTNMDQFATGLVGTRSPHGACSSVFDERYISGGSSSGSAVAVAQGLVTFALGTDTAGSGRVPAALCRRAALWIVCRSLRVRWRRRARPFKWLPDLMRAIPIRAWRGLARTPRRG